jgi:hypothetical protein
MAFAIRAVERFVNRICAGLLIRGKCQAGAGHIGNKAFAKGLFDHLRGIPTRAMGGPIQAVSIFSRASIVGLMTGA